MGIFWKDVKVTSTGQNWKKWQTLVGEKNGEVVKTLVFQACISLVRFLMVLLFFFLSLSSSAGHGCTFF